ncbi:hypothetical protein I7Z51_001987 [Vibrio parahaemolyticus]|uniref:Uncharacterized protein n=1 Tax=Vibrio parahaemolyticus TaxID=670 RepID=A0AAX1FZ31_VIBPH|nr:hypothetical protein [Vibrio parahaemolyticus]EGQ7973104.1 hypothetical protein [Vibrio parahaemolyticus]EGR1577341.1 hypothetical protein [Vibrio parahaemolyticus]ELA6982161.1 hypothetical protein [Vibrio parahaemolyticus]ELC3206143.1 hypothetical protein [Vibrio parahaemolyticus]MCI9688740.1 hypothetical protein [Vibrio parahaemolyticus]
MRRISKRYKSKLSRLYQIAKSNHITLAELIELKRRGDCHVSPNVFESDEQYLYWLDIAMSVC